jgi:predicted alpha-1,2-mannosidase
MSIAMIALSALLAATPAAAPGRAPATYVDPFIGTAAGGNVFPGAVAPFGMVAWSPETTRGDATRRPTAGGYAYEARRIRGLSLTHLSGTGCRGASGDVPFLPYTQAMASSPSADAKDETYAVDFSHTNEAAHPGSYEVRLASGVKVELAATTRTGSGRFTFPAGRPATLLIRTSDSEVGSSDATVAIDGEAHVVRGSVTSGNFCGYLTEALRRSYYTLHFVAVFDRPFAEVGTWKDATLTPGGTTASGGTGYDDKGYPEKGKGSGAFVRFDLDQDPMVRVRVGISYVSAAAAEANLAAENDGRRSFDEIRQAAEKDWNDRLRAIRIEGGTEEQRTIFYTALYHALLHPNVFSDADGGYWGFDQKAHRLDAPQRAQYANFSGWDVYRGQLQLLALLFPDVGSDVAQSLFNQARQYGGVWDRWTHNSGATHVMTGDPATVSVASLVAFGARDFDVKGAYDSLARAATVPTALDLSHDGCEVACPGQRPSLDKWLAGHFIPKVSHSWGGAGETLEDVSADFALAQLARGVGDEAGARLFRQRSGYWRNVFNPKATAQAGYMQQRNDDGTWPPFDPASDDGFAEGSSAQYTWMIPFDAAGLIQAMGGAARVNERLDTFFHHGDGGWALTRSGDLHAEMDNEPSIGAPWVYLYSGRPDKTQEIVRRALVSLWRATPYGIPGNDDLGAMSAWYVFASLGLYPQYPGRAELVLASPLFPRVVVHRGNGKSLTIRAPRAATERPYVQGLRVNGAPSTRSWLPESFVTDGGTLDFDLSDAPHKTWATRAADAPPSFPPETSHTP